MIYEYALEPAVLVSWASDDRDYADFLREYGIGNPRLISSFPKKRKSKLRSFLLQHSPTDSDSLAARRYLEMVQKVVEALVVRDVQHNEAGWVENAVLENKRTPFDVILSVSDTNEQNSITPESMHSPDNRIWECCRQLNVKRTYEEFLSKISNMVRLSAKEIVIIDPYCYNDRSITFIQNIAALVVSNRLSAELPSIKVIYKESNRSRTVSAVKEKILDSLPVEARSLQFKILEVKVLDEGDVFHNRCILTENAGIVSGHGFALTDNELHTDELVLMSEEIYQKKWQQFVEMNDFEIVAEATIEP